MEDTKTEKILANAITCIFLLNIDIATLQTLLTSLFFYSKEREDEEEREDAVYSMQ